jgi:hypothetical protein
MHKTLNCALKRPPTLTALKKRLQRYGASKGRAVTKNHKNALLNKGVR